MSTYPPLTVPKGTQHKCDNCGWTGSTSKLHDICDLWERLTAGGTVPSGQCPKCQALAYPMPPKKKPSQYPECEKMAAVRDKSQECGMFLDWLEENEYVEVETHKSREELLAEFYDIDLRKVEEERRVMLDAIRDANGKKETRVG